MTQPQDLDSGQPHDTEPRAHVRRRTTPKDMILSFSGLIGAISAVLISLGTITDALPFVQKTPYSRDWAANDVRMQIVEQARTADHELVTDLVHNSDLSLQLQLQTRVDALKAVMAKMPPNGSEYAALRATYDDLEQKLRALNRKLGQ